MNMTMDELVGRYGGFSYRKDSSGTFFVMRDLTGFASFTGRGRTLETALADLSSREMLARPRCGWQPPDYHPVPSTALAE